MDPEPNDGGDERRLADGHEPVGRAPGWYPTARGRLSDGSPAPAGTQRWWDGDRWSDRFIVPSSRPKASRLVTGLMIGLIVSGCVVLVLGPTVAANKQCPVPFGSPSPTGKTYTDPSGLFLPWLGLVALAALGVVVWQNLAPHVSWVKRAATWGVVAAIVTFPVFAAFLGATGCGP